MWADAVDMVPANRAAWSARMSLVVFIDFELFELAESRLFVDF
jgi:hypothetical protein